jgi:hypothetical protein
MCRHSARIVSVRLSHPVLKFLDLMGSSFVAAYLATGSHQSSSRRRSFAMTGGARIVLI